MDCYVAEHSIPSVRCSVERRCSYQASAWKEDLQKIMCMQGGDGDTSYVRNSEAPASAITLCTPLLSKAIDFMDLFVGESSLRIADLGCATGTNTLTTVDFVVDRILQRYEVESVSNPPEFEAYFSDLPSNDFNTLFRSLPHVKSSTEMTCKRRYFAAGVPGSFYDRLFSRGKLHVAISLSALHWMSKIPAEVLDKNKPTWNKGRAWIDGAKKEVVDAYAKQSADDLRAFLRCRAEEILPGGLLFFLMAGRPDAGNPEKQLGDLDSRVKHPFTLCMDQAWNDLVDEKLIDEDTRDSFNVPAYMRCVDEVQRGFDECKEFEVKSIEYHKVEEHSKEKHVQYMRDPASYGKTKANLVRATLKPLIEAHVKSPQVCEEFFKRFEKRAAEDINILSKTCYYGVIVVSAIRKYITVL